LRLRPAGCWKDVAIAKSKRGITPGGHAESALRSRSPAKSALVRIENGGIGFFNEEDSTRKGVTVQLRTSERIIRAEWSIEFAPAVRTQPARLAI